MAALRADSLDSATRHAVEYLDVQRSDDHLWRDFHTLAGVSTDWVSAFVTYAIASADGPGPRVLNACRALLARQRPNGGWSYNASVPTDCDSTAWAILALSAVPMWRPSAIQKAVSFLWDHQVEDGGGFATYSPRDGIERFTELPEGMTKGWRSPHPCVTAVTLQGLLTHGQAADGEMVCAAVDYLVDERAQPGGWRSYWWRGYGYTTYHALRALGMAGFAHDRIWLEAQTFLLGRQRSDGGWSAGELDGAEESTVFETSLTTLALLLRPTMDALAAAVGGVDWLLAAQKRNGAWPTSPILRIPPPMVLDPDGVASWQVEGSGTGVIVADQRATFTTAAALWAVSAFKLFIPAITAHGIWRQPR